MSAANNSQDPTVDYRKYPKSPSFLRVVIYATIALLIILVGAVFLVGHKAKTLAPHPPNPTPNSLVQPLLPAVDTMRLS